MRKVNGCDGYFVYYRMVLIMKLIDVNAKTSSYRVIISAGLMNDASTYIKKVTNAVNIAVITDDKVDELYSNQVVNVLSKSGFKVCKFVFKHGENSKNMQTVTDMLEFFAEHNLTRTDCIVALGGGITGDMAGFASAVYLRGIDFVQMPTTFLAAVDSSVGGKTGVNLKSGKNLSGAFHQPRLVLCDINSFNTLPDSVFAEGLAEAVKYGVICDERLFDRFSGDIKGSLEEIIAGCVQIKADIVSHDEFDRGERQLLNFGHTIGHAIEKVSDFKIPHGFAVGIGMVMISKAAYRLGFSEYDCSEPIMSVLTKNGIPVEFNCTAQELYNVMIKDKKRSGNSIKLVLPQKIGKCFLYETNVASMYDFLNEAMR